MPTSGGRFGRASTSLLNVAALVDDEFRRSSHGAHPSKLASLTFLPPELHPDPAAKNLLPTIMATFDTPMITTASTRNFNVEDARIEGRAPGILVLLPPWR